MKAFVVMPFNNETSNEVYTHCIKPVCSSFKLDLFRADEIFTSNIVMDDVISSIYDASIVIADISGMNPNVLYELGMAHILKKTQTIMIYHGEYSDVPFDIAHVRIIRYQNTIKGKSDFERSLKATIENILKDYKTIYRDEFELVSQTLLFSEQWSFIIKLIGIRKLNTPCKVGEKIRVECHDKTRFYRITSNIDVDEEERVFIKFKYLEQHDNAISITEKGKAFSDYLEETNNIVCDCINDTIFTKGFKPRFHKGITFSCGNIDERDF